MNMQKKLTTGAVAGLMTLALAAPAFAQVNSSAAAQQAASTGANMFAPRFSAQDIADRIAKEQSFLANIDAFVVVQKSATQAHLAALTAAADITDDAARKAAVQAADEALRTTIQSAIEANPDLASGMHRGKMGGKMGGMMGKGHGFGGGRHGSGPGPVDLAETLGMTPADLQTAIKSGKTIEQIAQEQGVTLPPRPAKWGQEKHQASSIQ